MVDFEFNENIHRVKQGKNWVYILEEEDDFSQLGYKMIQPSGPSGQEGLLHCAKIRYNGQIKLVYLTEDYQNLPSILATLPMNGVWTIFYKLLTIILKIKENDFLSCTNLDISPECIYFNPKTQEPYLIYVPIETMGGNESMPEFEESLRRSMISALKASNNALIQDREGALLSILSERIGGLEGLQKEILKNANVGDVNVTSMVGELELRCKIPAPPEIPQFIKVNKAKYMIGRTADNDSVISRKSISRHHCSITRRGNDYYIADEGSTYGTFINGKECPRGKEFPSPLRDKDLVKLSNIEFEVKI